MGQIKDYYELENCNTEKDILLKIALRTLLILNTN